jgi:hypothetical protein
MDMSAFPLMNRWRGSSLHVEKHNPNNRWIAAEGHPWERAGNEDSPPQRRPNAGRGNDHRAAPRFIPLRKPRSRINRGQNWDIKNALLRLCLFGITLETLIFCNIVEFHRRMSAVGEDKPAENQINTVARKEGRTPLFLCCNEQA